MRCNAPTSRSRGGFNSLLEMQKLWLGWDYSSFCTSKFQFYIGDADTGAEFYDVDDKPMFQFSIGDAHILKSKYYVVTSLHLFQFSIGDANSRQPQERPQAVGRVVSILYIEMR